MHIELTKRSKVHCLLTLMCRQKARRQLRNRLAGLSGLSSMHFRSYSPLESHCIHANIREEITLNTSYSHLFFSKNTGKKITVQLSGTSKRWIVSVHYSDSQRSLTSPHSKNFSVVSNLCTSIFFWKIPWNGFILTTVQSQSPPLIHPVLPADTVVIITLKEPEKFENISWKHRFLLIPICR